AAPRARTSRSSRAPPCGWTARARPARRAPRRAGARGGSRARSRPPGCGPAGRCPPRRNRPPSFTAPRRPRRPTGTPPARPRPPRLARRGEVVAVAALEHLARPGVETIQPAPVGLTIAVVAGPWTHRLGR